MLNKRKIALFLILIIFAGGYFYFRNVATEVRGLDGFYRWTKEDPLFYSPDLDINGMENAVSNIEKDQEDLLLYLNRKEHIYPTDFLKEFAKTAFQTSVFLKNPSKNQAQLLIEYQRKTVNLYRNEIRTLLNIIPTAYPDRNFSSVSINVSLSIGTIMDDLKKMENNSNVLLDEISRRERCLEEKDKCKIPSNNFKKPLISSPSKPSNIPNFIDKKFIFSPTSRFFNLPVMGPYRVKTGCFGLNPDHSHPEKYFYILPITRGGVNEGPVIKLATDVYFQVLNSDSILSWEREFANAGIKYIYSEASSPYRCNDANYLLEVSQINLFMTSNKPIFNQIKTDSRLDIVFLNNAQNFEKSFFESTYASYEDAQILADYYGYMYKLISDNSGLARKYAEISDEFLVRKLNLTRKLGGFAGMLNFSDAFIKTDIPVQKERNLINLTPIFIYAFKNYYGIMFTSFSSSIYRNTEKLNYVDQIYVENSIILDGARMSYTQAIRKYSQEEILKWFAEKPFLVNN